MANGLPFDNTTNSALSGAQGIIDRRMQDMLTKSLSNSLLRSGTPASPELKYTITQRLKDLMNVDERLRQENPPVRTVLQDKMDQVSNVVNANMAPANVAFNQQMPGPMIENPNMPNVNPPATKLAEMGGLMSMSPQARMNQGLMQFYEPVRRMQLGGTAKKFDDVRFMNNYSDEDKVNYLAQLLRKDNQPNAAKAALQLYSEGKGVEDILNIAQGDGFGVTENPIPSIGEGFKPFLEDAFKTFKKGMNPVKKVNAATLNNSANPKPLSAEEIEFNPASALVEPDAVTPSVDNKKPTPDPLPDPKPKLDPVDENNLKYIDDLERKDFIEDKSVQVDPMMDPDALPEITKSETDILDKAKKAKDPEKFLAGLSGKDLVVLGMGFLGTRNITEGAKASLTGLLKSREADRAHELAKDKLAMTKSYYESRAKTDEETLKVRREQLKQQKYLSEAEIASAEKIAKAQNISKKVVAQITSLASKYRDLTPNKIVDAFISSHPHFGNDDNAYRQYINQKAKQKYPEDDTEQKKEFDRLMADPKLRDRLYFEEFNAFKNNFENSFLQEQMKNLPGGGQFTPGDFKITGTTSTSTLPALGS